MRARGIAAALFGVALVAPGLFSDGARAADRAPARFDLKWQVEAACPDLDKARESIIDFLGPGANGEDADGASATTVRVQIARTPEAGYRARITTTGPAGAGERELEGVSCTRVAEAVALIVAMTLDPAAVAHRVTDWKVTAREERPRAPAPPPPPSAKEGTQVAIGVRATGDAGSLPAPSMGVSGSLGLHLARLHLEGEATAWVAQQALGGPGPKTGGEIGLYSGALRGCYDAFGIASGELRLGPCIAGEAGVSTGRGFGIVHPARSTGFWAAALTGLTVRQVASSPLTSWISLEVGLALRRPAFAIENYPVIFQPSLFVARASLGLAWIFP